MVYQSRIIEAEIQAGLENVGAVVIEGPRGCGKTETARQFSRSEVLLDGLSGSYEVAGVDPGILLEGPIPRLLDEWQLAPALWNAVRRRVDVDGVADFDAHRRPIACSSAAQPSPSHIR